MADNRDEEIVRFFLGDAIFADLTPKTEEFNYYIREIAKDLRSAHHVPRAGPLDESSKRLRLFEKLRRLLWSYDVFISYPHHDKEADAYARGLATALLKKRDVRIDLHETDSTREIPPKIIADLRRCRILAVVATPTGYVSKGVALEVDIFSPSKKHVIPIELGDGIHTAGWWQNSGTPKPVEDKLPFDEKTSPAFQQILTSCTIWHARRRRVAIALGLIVLTVVVGSYYSRLASFAISARDLALRTASDASNAANDAANNQSLAEAATNVAKQEKADALDAANNANNNAAAAVVREKDANNRADDANNAADEALNRETIAKAGEAKAIAEAQRQGRIANANDMVSTIQDHERPNPIENLAIVGQAFHQLLADSAPTIVSGKWIQENLPRVPVKKAGYNLGMKVQSGDMNPRTKMAAFVSEDKLRVLDFASGNLAPGIPIPNPSGWTMSNGRPIPRRLEVKVCPKGEAIIWDSGLVWYGDRKTVRLLETQPPPPNPFSAESFRTVDGPYCGDGVASQTDTAAAYSFREKGKCSVRIYDPSTKPNSTTFATANLPYLIALPTGGFSWLENGKIYVAKKTSGKTGQCYKRTSKPLPKLPKGASISFYGENPESGILEIILSSKDQFIEVSGDGVPNKQLFNIAYMDRRSTKRLVDPYFQATQGRIHRLSNILPEDSAFFIQYENGPNWVEVARTGPPETVLKFQMESNVIGAGYYWTSPKRKSFPSNFERTRSFDVVAWDQGGHVEVRSFSPYPLMYDSGGNFADLISQISPNGRFLASFDWASLSLHQITSGADGRMQLTEVGESISGTSFWISDKTIAATQHLKPILSLYSTKGESLAEIDLKSQPLGIKATILGMRESGSCLFVLCHTPPQRRGMEEKRALVLINNWETPQRQINPYPLEFGDQRIWAVGSKCAAFATRDNTLILWSPTKAPTRIDLRSEKINSLQYDRARNLWAVGTQRDVRFFDQNGQYDPKRTIEMPQMGRNLWGSPLSIAFGNQHSNIMAIMCADSTIRIVDTTSGRLVHTLLSKGASEICFGGLNDEYLVTSSTNASTKIWAWRPEDLERTVWERLAPYGNIDFRK